MEFNNEDAIYLDTKPLESNTYEIAITALELNKTIKFTTTEQKIYFRKIILGKYEPTGIKVELNHYPLSEKIFSNQNRWFKTSKIDIEIATIGIIINYHLTPIAQA